MQKQIQLERRVIKLNMEEFQKLCELEREVEGYIEKNFSGITFYFHFNGVDYKYGGEF
jgi:hypothetical protein